MKPNNVWSLHFKLEVFIWRHVVYVPKSFNNISRNFNFCDFSYYSSSAKSLRMTDMATRCDLVTPKRFPWKGARMRNRKLRNIRPSGAFSPEVTSSNVTPVGLPLENMLARCIETLKNRGIFVPLRNWKVLHG
jgi:hypothetical protein